MYDVHKNKGIKDDRIRCSLHHFSPMFWPPLSSSIHTVLASLFFVYRESMHVFPRVYVGQLCNDTSNDHFLRVPHSTRLNCFKIQRPGDVTLSLIRGIKIFALRYQRFNDDVYFSARKQARKGNTFFYGLWLTACAAPLVNPFILFPWTPRRTPGHG